MPRSLHALALALVSLPAAALAHGINGHVHVTGWAIERLPPGEVADFFADPELFETALFAASFPDSGYAIDDPYGEMAHWPPFLEAYLRHLRAEVGPPFDTPEKRRLAAFAIGMACHGLQDEIFDSVFLHHIREHDGEGQDSADTGTDAMLYTDGYLRFKPPQWAPLDALVSVFADEGHAVEPQTIEAGMMRVKFLVIDNFHTLAPTFDRRYRPLLPWTAEHYVDPAVPGSLAAEIPATGAFIEALWHRLHGRPPVATVVSHPYPDGRRRLMSVDPDSAGSWVTLVLGIGARVGSVTTDRVHLEGPDGPVPFDLRHTRWGGAADDWTRIVQLRPRAALTPDAEYVVRLDPGFELIDGQIFEQPWQHAFRTPCADADTGPDPACPPEPADGGILPVDAAVDAAPESPPDVGPLDAAAPDVAPPAAADGGPVDGSADITPEPAPPAPGATSDGCRAAPAGPLAPPWSVTLLAPLLVAFRRFSRRAR